MQSDSAADPFYECPGAPRGAVSHSLRTAGQDNIY